MGIFMSVEEAIKEKIREQKNVHVMLIEGWSKLWTHDVQACQSSVFKVSGHEWKLIVYPAGKNGTSDYVSLYLRIKDKESLSSTGEVECCIKLLVVDDTLLKLCNSVTLNKVRFNAKQAIHGKDCFMTHSDFKRNHIRDGNVVFGVEITNVKSNCASKRIPRKIGTAERIKLNEVPPNNSRHTWKIKRFSSHKDGLHKSQEFTVGPRKWYIQMAPNGEDQNTRGYLSLALAATENLTKGPKAKTLAVCKLRLLNQLHRDHYEAMMTAWYHYELNHDRSRYGLHNYFPLQQLNDPSKGYLVDDHIYLGVEFLLVSTTEYL